MQFGLTESQEFLKNSARQFFAGECPSSEMRHLAETDTAYDAALWSKLAEQGYTGIIYPEDYGGVGLGKVELMLLMEEAGRALLPGPFFSTAVLAGSVLDAAGTPGHKKQYLEPICKGEVRSTVAILEAAASWNPGDIQLSASNGKLTGQKLFVSDAAVADFIVVVARNGVFVVDSKAHGLKISPMSGMDLTRKLYAVEFNNTPAAELGPKANLSRVFDIATVGYLMAMAGAGPMVEQFGGNYLRITVRTADGALFQWHIEVFELQRDGTYSLLTQAIEMRSFPVDDIREALGRRFTDIEVLGGDGNPAGHDDEDRIWLACTKPS